MKRLKKNSIGFNTISSTNGLVSARGVKCKPDDLQVVGFTHEGEKLDSGNINLCKEWNYTSNLFTIIGNRITVQKASNIIPYKISSLKELTYDKTKIYIHFKYSGSFTAGAKSPVCSIKLYNAEKKELYYIMIGDRYPINRFNTCIEINLSSIDINSIAYYTLIVEGLTSDGSADYDFTIDVLMCKNYISSYFEDEHSIVLTNNDMSIQVPIPIPLSSAEGVSDHIFKDNDGIWKLKQSTKKIDSYASETILTPFVSSTGSLSAGATVIYQLEIPIVHVLSNYAQELLNSFELQNENNIYVEGYPDLKISGYLQKR